MKTDSCIQFIHLGIGYVPYIFLQVSRSFQRIVVEKYKHTVLCLLHINLSIITEGIVRIGQSADRILRSHQCPSTVGCNPHRIPYILRSLAALYHYINTVKAL